MAHSTLLWIRSILVILMGLGAGLIFIDFGIEDLDLSTGTVVLGSLLFIGSCMGLVAALMSRPSNQVPSDLSSDWHPDEKKGEWEFVWSLTQKLIPWIVLGIAASIYLSYRNGEITFTEGVRNYSILTVVVIGILVSMGIVAWNYYQRVYVKPNAGIDEDLQTTGGIPNDSPNDLQ